MTMDFSISSAQAATWSIACVATAGVILRPWNVPEALWAVLGAGLLLLFGLLPVKDGLAGIAKGIDVYLFLTGMMLLAEVARQEGLFDWLAAVATRLANGSATRLFFFIYLVGTIVTAFLSNDATAVVLTPAVAAAVKTANAAEPLPFLFICAFIANAASFVLPISNPANLVIYGNHMPPLSQWLAQYTLASALSVVSTFAVLHWSQRKALHQKIALGVALPNLSRAGKIAAAGIVLTSAVLLAASALDIQLGLPTAIAGAITATVVLVSERKAPWQTVKDISWSVLPLVAGLFVLVEALDDTGVIHALSSFLHEQSLRSADAAAWGSGIAIAFMSNLTNNLPAGLIAGSAVQTAHVSDEVTRAILIGVDLGPNLSVTGSLATILWLTALRREGQQVGAGAFLKLGCVIMPPALIMALGGALIFH